MEPKCPQPDGRLSAPAFAEGEQAVQRVEMHAVAVRQVERCEPTDRFAAPSALPLGCPLAVQPMPAPLHLAPSEPRGLRGRVERAPVIGQRLAVACRPAGGLGERRQEFALVLGKQPDDGLGLLRSAGLQSAFGPGYSRAPFRAESTGCE